MPRQGSHLGSGVSQASEPQYRNRYSRLGICWGAAGQHSTHCWFGRCRRLENAGTPQHRGAARQGWCCGAQGAVMPQPKWARKHGNQLKPIPNPSLSPESLCGGTPASRWPPLPQKPPTTTLVPAAHASTCMHCLSGFCTSCSTPARRTYWAAGPAAHSTHVLVP